MTCQIFTNPLRIKCLECDLTSYNINDVDEKYCPQCHKFHSDEAWREWYDNQLGDLVDYLKRVDPLAFEQLVDDVKERDTE